jgi:hypothetical protein
LSCLACPGRLTPPTWSVSPRLDRDRNDNKDDSNDEEDDATAMNTKATTVTAEKKKTTVIMSATKTKARP